MTGANGQLLFTGEEVSAGQEVFLKNGLVEYGSIFGHGAYLGPDFTADYLHRAALIANDLNGSSSQTPRESTIADFKASVCSVVSDRDGLRSIARCNSIYPTVAGFNEDRRCEAGPEVGVVRSGVAPGRIQPINGAWLLGRWPLLVAADAARLGPMGFQFVAQ